MRIALTCLTLLVAGAAGNDTIDGIVSAETARAMFTEQVALGADELFGMT